MNFQLIFENILPAKTFPCITIEGPLYVNNVLLVATLFALSVLTLLLVQRRKRNVRLDKEKLETIIDERTAQLRDALADREILLKEIHHRVKNNLQVISGLLELQSSRITDKEVKTVFAEAQNRVMSIAIVHQNLYQYDRVDAIDFHDFSTELIRHVQTVFSKKEISVEIANHIGKVFIDIETAVPLGLILNELLTNSFKYAFDENTPGKIDIDIERMGGGTFLLTYEDNGPGLPEGVEIGKSNSLGLRLIKNLSRQVGGRAKYHKMQGSLFTITFQTKNSRKADN